MNHSLDYYYAAYPFNRGLFKNLPGIFSLPSSDIFSRFQTKIDVNQSFDYKRSSLWLGAKWDNFTILVEPVIVNAGNGVDILGVDYTRAGVSGRIINSYLQYDAGWGNIQFGRAPVWWGQSWQSSIIQSGHFPAYDHASLTLDVGSQFQYKLLSGQLSSEELEDGSRVKRFIAGHQMAWLPQSKQMIFGFGEQIIYSGINRSLELVYLNPAIPYFFTALEGDEKTNPDNDNSIIFVYGRYNIRRDLSAYFEFIVDDYQVDENTTPNALGYKLGLDGGFGLLDGEFSYVVEFTRVDSWTYIHHGQFTNWQNRGHSLGYEYGPDSRAIMLLGEYWLGAKYKISLASTFLAKGNNTLTSEWSAPGTRGDSFPSNPVEELTCFSMSASRYFKYGIIALGYTNSPLKPGEINGELVTMTDYFYFSLNLFLGRAFTLQ